MSRAPRARHTGFSVDPASAVEHPRARLSDAFDRFLEVVADNRQVTFDDDGWQPGERVDPGEVCALLAAILAHGCNLGLYSMEKVAPDIACRRLKYVSDWRLVEENRRGALAAIVHGISRLDAARHWGDGTTSASDGQRFAMPQNVLQRTYSTRFNDFALEFHSFVADNYAPFYSRPIECTDRDAPFVLAPAQRQPTRRSSGSSGWPAGTATESGSATPSTSTGRARPLSGLAAHTKS